MADFLIRIIFFVLIIILAMLVHEVGHLATYKMLTGRRPSLKVRWGGLNKGIDLVAIDLSELKHLTKRQIKSITAVGLASGLLPIFFSIHIFGPLELIGALWIYVLGSWNDIQIMYQKGE